ncbi:hypothetical protein Hanom_Chr07g00639971 [Helianthus anomalus]
MSKLETKCVTKCKPQGLSVYFWKKLGTKCVTQCKPQGPFVYFWKAREQIKNFGKSQGPSVYFTLKSKTNRYLEKMRLRDTKGVSDEGETVMDTWEK